MIDEARLVTEVSITAKDENCKVIEKDTYYGRLEISENNPFINKMVADAVTKLGTQTSSEPPDISVKTKTVWQ